jgi:hypothetical protein
MLLLVFNGKNYARCQRLLPGHAMMSLLLFE